MGTDSLSSSAMENIVEDSGLPGPLQTEGGLIEGAFEDGLSVYRGIPFAEPPVGVLRWRAPQPVKPWEGIIRAYKFAASTIQRNMVLPTLGPLNLDTSEDCLYLNVWTPAKSPQDSLPVMVWIHGGGFASGSPVIPLYSGENFAKKGVVFVSIAHRVGPLGFLAHPGLSAESEHKVSGNYGLLDQIAGLKWIQRNIAVFGGNPDCVTIFGESTGAISVSILSASPLAKGLFHRAISQSGGSFGPTRTPPEPGENLQRLADAERMGEEFAGRMNAQTVEVLRTLSPEQILEGSATQVGISWPVLDGWVIADDQYKLYESGKYHDIPVLIGTNSDEGAILSIKVTSDQYIKNVYRRFGPFADTILKLFPGDTDPLAKKANGDIFRDAGFAWHTWIWAKLQAKTGKSKVYFYFFDQRPPYTKDSPFTSEGAPHGAEIAYVFRHLDQRNLPWTDDDRALSEMMADYWTNFAKYGNPNGKGLPEWPVFKEGESCVMYLKSKPEIGHVANMDKLSALDDYFTWRRSLLDSKP